MNVAICVVMRSFDTRAEVPAFVIVFAPTPQKLRVGVVVVLAWFGKTLMNMPGV